MALTEGRDFVLARNMTYTGTGGIGKGCLTGTMELMLLLPATVHRGSGRHTEEKDIFIEGKGVVQYLEETLARREMNTSNLSTILRDLAQQVEGARLIDLSAVRRLKVRTSFFSRGVYTSEKSSGPGWTGFPLKKQDAAAFENFYRGHPATAGA